MNCFLPSASTVAPYFSMDTQRSARTCMFAITTNKTSAVSVGPHLGGHTGDVSCSFFSVTAKQGADISHPTL